jgi:hypothetical protein
MFSLQPSDDGETLGEYIGGTVSCTIGFDAVTIVNGTGSHTIDPYPVLSIDSLAWDDGLARDEELNAQDHMVLEAAVDQDGDGLLTAQLGLSFSIGGSQATLVRFTLDLSTGYYTWYEDIPELLEAVYAISPVGGLHDALQDMDYNEQATAWYNAALQAYTAYGCLVCTDGSEILLGSGDIIDMEDELFTESGLLSWYAEDNYVDISNLTPAYLRIGDTTYELQ